MSTTTTIEWTNATWNPVRGCAIVSKGCTHCYAMRQAHRHAGAGGAYEGLTRASRGGPVWTGEVRTVPELLNAPLHWKKPRRIFVNSMSDLFHEGVPDDFIAQVWRTMAWSQRHTYQILTKRPKRMLEWVAGFGFDQGRNAVFAGESEEYEAALKAHGWPLRNVQLGVSVEDQAGAAERIPLLLATPAAVRWISAEPLLGPVNLRPFLLQKACDRCSQGVMDYDNPHLHGRCSCECHAHQGRLHWVVAGGESGAGARPSHPDWFRSLRDQCAAAGVPFFFKQWGSWLPRTDYYADGHTRDQWCLRAGCGKGVQLLTRGGSEWVVGEPGSGGRHDGQPPDGTWVVQRLDKHTAGRQLDGREHNEYPR